ncbi:hypothetical protein GEMRC1_000761 [Eukaryota sp. GEM-RC1]
MFQLNLDSFTSPFSIHFSSIPEDDVKLCYSVYDLPGLDVPVCHEGFADYIQSIKSKSIIFDEPNSINSPFPANSVVIFTVETFSKMDTEISFIFNKCDAGTAGPTCSESIQNYLIEILNFPKISLPISFYQV